IAFGKSDNASFRSSTTTKIDPGGGFILSSGVFLGAGSGLDVSFESVFFASDLAGSLGSVFAGWAPKPDAKAKITKKLPSARAITALPVRSWAAQRLTGQGFACDQSGGRYPL